MTPQLARSPQVVTALDKLIAAQHDVALALEQHALVLEQHAQYYPRALAEAIARTLLAVCPELFTDRKPAVRDLHPSLEGNAIEAMARWIYGEIKAARRNG